jgi:dCTP deaminase
MEQLIMTLLRHQELKAAISAKKLSERLVIMPMLDPDCQVGPASVDVRLGTQFHYLERSGDAGIDVGTGIQNAIEIPQHKVTVDFGSPFWLHPGQFVLGATLEFLRLPDTMGAYVVGRSTWGRLGLLVATAIMLQPGWGGNLTLELVNHGESPIALYAGSKIAQLAVHSLNGATGEPYNGEYMGPTGPWGPQVDSEHDRIEKLKGVAARLRGE